MKRNIQPLVLISLALLAGYSLGGQTGLGIAALIIFIINVFF